MNNKKICALIIAIISSLSLASCSEDINKKEKNISSSLPDSSSISESTTVEATENNDIESTTEADESSVTEVEEPTTETPTEKITENIAIEPTEQPTEIPFEQIENKSLSDTEFFELLPLSFSFSSGVGGWETHLSFSDAGSFIGEYHDTNYDLILNEETNTEESNVIYDYCNFKGSLKKLDKINDYTYSVKFENIEILNDTVFDDEFLNQITRIDYKEEVYGVDDECEYYVYFSGAPTSELPEGFLSWISMPLSWGIEDIPETLPYTCIYNVNTEQAFIGY